MIYMKFHFLQEVWQSWLKLFIHYGLGLLLKREVLYVLNIIIR